jgi:hypothetical protein
VKDSTQNSVTVTRYPIEVSPCHYVPYEGSDARVRADFPDGFLPSYGSGLAFKGKDANGALVFIGLADRGPNGDAPKVPAPGGEGAMDAKFFPSPSFVPALGAIFVDSAGARLAATMPIRFSNGKRASGLPPPSRSAVEVPLLDALRYDPAGKAVYNKRGIDSEGIAYDSRRQSLWIGDEYGPYLARLDPANGMLLVRYGPGDGLPPIFAQRRVNRGMEGLTFDLGSDRLHAFLQSPISAGKAHCAATAKEEKVERYAAFTRWIEFDPVACATTRMFAFPLNAADYHRGRTGNAKLGDLAALGKGRFVVIEQGEGPDGAMFNRLVLVDIAGATDIGAARFNPDSADLEKSSMAGHPVGGADWKAVTPLRKTTLLNLNAIGWRFDKAEGLAVVDEHTLAITSDNDFSLKSRLFDTSGKQVDGVDVTELALGADGELTGSAAGGSVRITPNEEKNRVPQLWLIRFSEPL